MCISQTKPFKASGRCIVAAASLVVAASTMSLRGQVSGTWINDSDGSWSNAAGWSSNPNYPASDGVALLGGQNTLARTITLDVPITLSELDNASSKGYTVAASVPASQGKWESHA
jgi:hypothetical protein